METLCTWNSAYLLIFSENVDTLTYYSHLLPLIASIMLGVLVLINNPKAIANRVLFFMTTMFGVWVYFDLILWASPSPDAVMFFWSSIVPIELLIYASGLYLVYIFQNGMRDISLSRKIAIIVFFIPIIFLTHTAFNVVGLSPDCNEGAIEGPLIQYMYIIELVFILWTLIVTAQGYLLLPTKTERVQMLIIGTGVILFLLTFTAGNLALVFSIDPLYEQYKLFGMPIFAALITYSIVRFKTFNAKVLSVQALVVATALLVLSMLFLRTIESMHVVAGITFILVSFVGYYLVRGVMREIAQREEIQKLATELAQANLRLRELDQLKTEFVGIASHQLRAPVTAIKGYASMMMEKTYGEIPVAAQEAVARIFESSKHMSASIDDFLNIGRIEQGNMKYDIQEFDLGTLAKRTVEEFLPLAEKKGLKLVYHEIKEGVIGYADENKSKQIMTNLIDNAIKYTPKGTVVISVTSDLAHKKILFSVKDSGIGLSAEDQKKLFTKFTRASNANTASVQGTGLGLYVAIQMAKAQGGTITVSSEGVGKGSTFTFEIPTK